MKTQFIQLNMTPSGINPTFHIAQYDVGRLLGFYVYNGSEVVDLDDYTCTIEATRTDGTQITADVITTDNQGVFAVTAEMSNEADKYACQLVIIDSNANRIASLPFIMDVITAALNGNAESISEDRTLYQQYNAAMQAALANEADNRINADNLEKVTRQSAVDTLQNNIDAEATARANAINAEATARAENDATLQTYINAEATARQTADNTLQGNINSEASTRETQDGFLQSQINQIIAPSGEAPSAAEVQNARIGVNGETYDTLGNAIRKQVSAEAHLRNDSIKGAIYQFSTGTVQPNHTVVFDDIFIPKGTVGKLTISNIQREGEGYYQFYVFASDGTNNQRIAKVTAPQTYTFDAERDTTKIRVFCTADAVAGSFDAVITYQDIAGIHDLKDFSEKTDNYCFQFIYNLFNKDNIVAEKYVTGEVGSAISLADNSSFAHIRIPCNPLTSYTLTGYDYYIYEVNDIDIITFRYGNGSQHHDNVTITTHRGTTALYINYKPSVNPTDTYMMVEGSSLPSKYVPYGNPVVLEDALQEVLDKRYKSESVSIYYVGPNREYTSLMALCEELSEDDTEKIVYIDAGIYDIFSEIGGSEFALAIEAGTNWKDVSTFIPPNTKIIGLGNVVLQFTPTAEQIGNIANDLLSPINVKGNFAMENIIIKAENCRYGIHDDCSNVEVFGDYAQHTSYYKNVMVYKSGSGKAQALGGGCIGKSTFNFENCLFQSGSLPFSYHNNNGMNDGTNCPAFYIKNCTFVNTGSSAYALRFGNVNWRQEDITVLMSNCYLNKKIYLFKEASGNARQAFDLTLVNCSNVEIEQDTMTDNIYTPVVYRN